MQVRRVKFIWGASRVIKGRWFLGLFGLYDRIEGDREGALAISVRGLLVLGLVVALGGYVSGATALFWVWQRNPYNLLTRGDAFLYPLRRAKITEKKGQAFIAQGTDLFRAEKYQDAATLLRLGLARVPHDFPARRLLAQYYFLANQRPAATKLLDEGLTEEYPGRAYLDTVFNAAELGEDFDRIAQIAERYGPLLRAEGPHRDYRWIVGRQFAALTAAGRHREALALALREEPGEAAREHRVLALLALGRPEEALAVLAEWRGLAGADRRAEGRLRVRALREAEKFEEMEAAIAELRTLAPGDASPAVYGVIQRVMAGGAASADAALQDYLFRFGGSPQNLILLAEPLAEIGARAQLQQCMAAAAERGYSLRRFNVLLVQLLVQQGEWAAAKGILATMSPETGREGQSNQTWLTWMQRLVEAGRAPGEAAHLALVEMLRERPWPLHMFRRTVEALVVAGRFETAREAIAIAARTFPSSAWLQVQATRVAAEISSRETPAAAAPAMRLPEEAIFFGQLDEAIVERRWGDAARMIRDARAATPAPPWVAEREAGLRLAQVRIHQGNGDRLAMMTAARLFLNGDHERARQLLEAAQEFFRDEDKDSALAVVREVVAGAPDFSPAKRLLAEWEPKPGKEK